MNEQIREKEAKQGRSGKQTLIVMIVSLALMALAWLIWEGVSGSDAIDEQAVAPSGEATTVETDAGTVVVPENTPVTRDGEVVTVPEQQAPALGTGAEETPNASGETPIVTPAPQGN